MPAPYSQETAAYSQDLALSDTAAYSQELAISDTPHISQRRSHTQDQPNWNPNGTETSLEPKSLRRPNHKYHGTPMGPQAGPIET